MPLFSLHNMFYYDKEQKYLQPRTETIDNNWNSIERYSTKMHKVQNQQSSLLGDKIGYTPFYHPKFQIPTFR